MPAPFPHITPVPAETTTGRTAQLEARRAEAAVTTAARAPPRDGRS